MLNFQFSSFLFLFFYFENCYYFLCGKPMSGEFILSTALGPMRMYIWH